MRFVLFVIDQASNSGNDAEMARIDAFNDSLRDNGTWVMAAGIAGPSSALLVDGRGESEHVAPGSLFGGPDFYSGFWVIDVADIDEARRLAIAGSRACARRVELRPFIQ